MATDDLTGRVLGEYKLVEIIGRGGMATVYRASDRALNREVAVKVMSSALSHQENYAQRFTQEARTAASLEHIHIVPIYRYGTQDNITYIVMRLLTGGSLAQRIAQRERANQPLPSLREIAEMLRQVASALQFGHDRGIIHRDIKSSNIMFDNNGSAMVVDFGIARLQEATVHMTTSGAQIGTPAYMAPEQWRGENPTPQVDQYALAIVIFNVLSGKLPFEASATHTMMYKHLNEPPPPVHTLAINVPEGISYVLQRALAKDPEERYPTITSFAGAFLDVVAPMHSTNTEFFTYKIRQTSPPGTGTGSRPGSGSGDGSGGRRQTAGGSGSRHPSSLARGRTAQRGTLLPWLIGGGAVAIIAILAFALIAQNQNNNEPTVPATQAVAANVTGTSPAQENSGSVIIITRAPASQAQLTDEVGAEATEDAGAVLSTEPTMEASAGTQPTATRPPTETSSPTEPPPTPVSTREATEGSAALPLVSESSPSPEPTVVPTAQPSDTDTPTETPQPSDTPTATSTPAPTETWTPSPTITDTATITPSVTPTNTPTIEPTATPRPSDLVIVSMDGDQQPQLAVGAAQVRLPITATVRNDGESDTGSFRFQFRLRPDDLIFAQGQAASLAPGETVTLQADVPLREPGAYVVQLEVDFTEAVAESSEMNNIEFFSVTLRAEPTATLTPTDTFTPTPPATETPIPTDTPLPTATFTDTPVPPTATPVPPTDTPMPTMTATLTPCQSADLNADGQVNIFDVRLVGGAVGSRDVDDLTRFDFDMDGDIDIFDLRRVSRQYGADCNAVG